MEDKSSPSALPSRNAQYLRQGINLLGDINIKHYTTEQTQQFESSIGAHVRHILDYYECFFKGLCKDIPGGIRGGHAEGDGINIDYNSRQRDKRIELDKAYAMDRLRGTVERLDALPNGSDSMNQIILINTDAAEVYVRSTIGRELQFLLMHTIHHYAIMAVMLRNLGFFPDREFGMAPSTITYQASIERFHHNSD